MIILQRTFKRMFIAFTMIARKRRLHVGYGITCSLKSIYIGRDLSEGCAVPLTHFVFIAYELDSCLDTPMPCAEIFERRHIRAVKKNSPLQSFLGLHLPRRSQFTNLCYNSWVQTIYSDNNC